MKRFLSVAVVVGIALAMSTPAYANHGFKISNTGRHTITAVQISSPKLKRWGPNLISAPLRPGMYATFTIGEGCMEDVMVHYRDGHYAYQYNVNTCRVNITASY